ncbi:hypothetical protein N7527_003161 [Penicillium freii]|nr:hypothetical protein N7527_003161 [Penicillium freii]
MSLIQTDGFTDPIVSPHKPVPFTYDSSTLMSDLPDGYVVHHFSHFKLLRTSAKILLDSLQSESETQWPVILE